MDGTSICYALSHNYARAYRVHNAHSEPGRSPVATWPRWSHLNRFREPSYLGDAPSAALGLSGHTDAFQSNRLDRLKLQAIRVLRIHQPPNLHPVIDKPLALLD